MHWTYIAHLLENRRKSIMQIYYAPIMQSICYCTDVPSITEQDTEKIYWIYGAGNEEEGSSSTYYTEHYNDIPSNRYARYIVTSNRDITWYTEQDRHTEQLSRYKTSSDRWWQMVSNEKIYFIIPIDANWHAYSNNDRYNDMAFIMHNNRYGAVPICIHRVM
jgi:hypothetical protein